MNRATFYDEIRPIFGGSLSVSQVNGMNLILDEGDRRGINNEFLAYCLATTSRETGRRMQPIHELGTKSYFNKYEPGTSIGKMLGNTKKGDGYLFRGRGLVQITGRRNYALATKKLREMGFNVDFIARPDDVLIPEYAIIIMFVGMSEGWFTGKSLDDYLDGVDEDDKEDLREFCNARRIINGTDHQIEIGENALDFEHAIRASGRLDTGNPTPIEIPPVPSKPALTKPVPPVLVPEKAPSTPIVDDLPPATPIVPKIDPAKAFYLTSIVAVLGGAGYWFIHLPCNAFGLFCGS